MKLNEASKTAKRKSFLMLFSLVLILVFAVGGTIAYIVTSTNDVQNTFEPAQVSCKITEEFSGQSKENVQITNTSNVSAYIRAAIVITWKDSDGKIYNQSPEVGIESDDKDCRLDLGSDWVKFGDYYYYCNPVPAGQTIDNPLIIKCSVSDSGKVPSGYSLSVEILADAIQSEPPNAVGEAWGVAFENGGVVPYTTPSGN